MLNSLEITIVMGDRNTKVGLKGDDEIVVTFRLGTPNKRG